jgi:hypothetical protein
MQIILKVETNAGEFSTNDSITIQLFNSPVIVKWADTFFKKTYELRLEYWDYKPDHYVKNISVDNQWQQLKYSFERLKMYGLTIPYQLPDTFDYNQETLNIVHRFFTYNAMWLGDLENTPNLTNPFDANFEFPKHLTTKEWLDIIVLINNAVHDLEHVANLTTNKKIVNDHYPIRSLEVLPTDHDTWLEFSNDEFDLQYTYLNHNENNLVLLNRSILGKPIIQSFYDNDDPTAKDCTGRFGSNGGFVIDTNANRKKLYRSRKFMDWLNLYNINYFKIPFEFPIGYVADSTKPLDHFFEHFSEFKSITWID